VTAARSWHTNGHTTSGRHLPSAAPGCTCSNRNDNSPRPRSRSTGLFPCVWQVMGSNHRRLSRRFYRPLSFTQVSSRSPAHMHFEARYRAACSRASMPTGNSSGPRTGTRLATDGAAGAVTLTARHFPGRRPRPAVSTAGDPCRGSAGQPWQGWQARRSRRPVRRSVRLGRGYSVCLLAFAVPLAAGCAGCVQRAAIAFGCSSS
jgi:hypothetical protein